MPYLDYPDSFRELTKQLRRLPGIGPRGAERIALWMFSSPHAHPEYLSEALKNASTQLMSCRLCGFFSSGPYCSLCSDTNRASKELCVVEMMTDILPLERSGAFHGRYHALGGKLSPLDGVGPEQLRIAELMERVVQEQPPEVILALGSDVEGEATAHYLAELLEPTGVKITRIAQGLPAGGGVEQADPLTLQRALMNRGDYSTNRTNNQVTGDR
ncbi:MAG TPA: recombination mediator RecR [Chthoniobacterales bacterium]|nr:recombination mediator RecR [Chthoniobacterales bacterium]